MLLTKTGTTAKLLVVKAPPNVVVVCADSVTFISNKIVNIKFFIINVLVLIYSKININ